MQICLSPYSVKSSTELQRGERDNEAKIHRQHQDEQKVSKQDLVSKADSAARSDTEGRTASPVAEAAKEKDTKLRRYFRSSKSLHTLHNIKYTCILRYCLQFLWLTIKHFMVQEL